MKYIEKIWNSMDLSAKEKASNDIIEELKCKGLMLNNFPLHFIVELISNQSDASKKSILSGKTLVSEKN